MLQKRVHVWRDKKMKKRTTFSIEHYLYELFIDHLGHDVYDKNSLKFFTEWVQEKVFEKRFYSPRRRDLSQFIRREIVFELVG